MSLTSDIGIVISRKMAAVRQERFSGPVGVLRFLALSFVCSAWLTMLAVSLGTGLETGRYFFWGGAAHWDPMRLLQLILIKWPADSIVQAMTLRLFGKCASKGARRWILAAVVCLLVSVVLTAGNLLAADLAFTGSLRHDLVPTNWLEILYASTTVLPVTASVVSVALLVSIARSGARIALLLAIALVVVGKLLDALNPAYVFPNWYSFHAALPAVILVHVGVLLFALSSCLAVVQGREKDPELEPARRIITCLAIVTGFLVWIMPEDSPLVSSTKMLFVDNPVVRLGAAVIALLMYFGLIETLVDEVSRWVLRQSPPRSPWWITVPIGIFILVAFVWREAEVSWQRDRTSTAELLMDGHDDPAKSRSVVDQYMTGIRPNLMISSLETPFLSMSSNVVGHFTYDQSVVEYAMRRMLQAGGDVRLTLPYQWRSPLADAAWSDQVGIARMLIDAGADVNQRTGYDILETQWQRKALALGLYYPIHLAARSDENGEMLRLLLEHGADPMARTADGQTPLHMVLSESAARVLIGAGADVNARDNRNGTPLHDAATAGSLPLVRFLIERGANPNARDDAGRTPLASLKRSMLVKDEDRFDKIGYLQPLTTEQ